MSLWVFILNPVAGAGRLQKSWPAMRETLLAAGVTFEEHWTEAPGAASRLAQEAIQAGHRHLVGVGGDGTNNEIINGIYGQQVAPATEITYALLPFGTGNDWVRTHGIPHDLTKWIHMLKASRSILHDLGWVDYYSGDSLGEPQKLRRYFANVAGLGYDAHIVQVAEGYRFSQRNKLLYLWLVLRELWGFQPPKLALAFNGEKIVQHFYTINIGICKYSGGGMQLVSHANPKSGSLALTLIRNFPKWRVIVDTPKLFTGRLEKHRYTRMAHTDGLEVRAAGEEALMVEADGELLGQGPLKFGVLSAAVRVVVP